MKIALNTSVERIVAKIDNDFNPDNSDWIPRVAAWCIEAMSQVNALRKTKKRTRLAVRDRIVYSACELDLINLVVYDDCGCKVVNKKSSASCGNASSTGEVIRSVTPKTVDYVYTGESDVPDDVRAEHVLTKDYPSRYNVKNIYRDKPARDYVIVNNRQLELNYDADFVEIEQYEVETIYSEYYQEELPVIPEIGDLIEGITNYCMYKMLCRGVRHPIFNLAASQYGTNPYYMWNTAKDKLKNEVIKYYQGEELKGNGLWRSSFFISTFNPRG